MTRYDRSALKDPEINRLYNTVALKNRYESLCQEGQTITETYAHLITANEETPSEHLPKKKSGRKKQKAAQDPRVEEARKQVQYTSSIYHTLPAPLQKRHCVRLLFLPLVSYKNVRIIPRYYSNKRRRRDFFSWYTLSSSHRTHMKHQVRSRTTRQFIKYDPTLVTYVFMNRNNEIT